MNVTSRRLGGVGLAAVLAGLAGSIAGAQTLSLLSLSPAPAITINGQSASVFSVSLKGGNGMTATGQVAYPQSFPAAATSNSVPPSIQTASSLSLSTVAPISLSLNGTRPATPLSLTPVQPAAPTVSDYSCATYRPDFRYQAPSLAFERQTTTDLKQIDMCFWPGLPPGSDRYVPLGEY